MGKSFYVGITDTNWFSLLREDYNSGILSKEVNFWTPGTREFKALNPGDLFLFKMHNKKSTGEHGEIVGGGYFSHYSRMTIDDAWEQYGRANGRNSLEIFQKSLKGIQEKNNVQSNYKIGCIILENVFFLDRWIAEPSDWGKSIVSGKKYTTDTKTGADLYNSISYQMKQKKLVEPLDNSHSIEEQEYQATTMDLESLRAAAETHSKKETVKKEVIVKQVARDPYVAEYAKQRAKGICQLCGAKAPFEDAKGRPYLESHHIVWIAKGGEDSIANTVGLCPNCHRKMHIVNDVKDVEYLLNIASINNQ